MLGPDATCGDLDATTPEERAAWYRKLVASWEQNTRLALEDDDRVDAKIHAMNNEWCG